ncbi:hypothetical protein GCM10010912_59050 [Paenibacillus albidus]|uniref:YbbR-like domain-containing protein n=1 Tax=Paenibacillus albidus TaxID=2041023 RepID=A0A917D2A8_9BACL|nr:CdaR family protein [Paenibacillus albidus]GGG06606.1 hypothetical protein GCM10010912_59050 [Paenibacillus albidus]
MDKWINNNTFTKILAIALGIVLWAMVHADTDPVSSTTVRLDTKIIENVQIEVTGLDEEKYVLQSKDADSVRMEVRGNNSDLTFKLSDAYRVTLDLSKVEPGDNTLPLNYFLPNGVTLESMTPSEVNVHVELRNTKAFPVTVNTSGAPAEGYQVGTPVIEPETAKVTLADSELSRVVKVQGTIELDGENETFTEKKIKLYAYDKNGKEIKDAVIDPSSVSAEIPITLPNKSVPLDIGFTGKLPDSLVLSGVTPELENIVVYGSKQSLEALSSYQATVDLGSIDTAGTRQLEVELTPPAGTQKVEPGKVSVSISTSEVVQRTFDNIPIRVEGAGSGLEAVITDPPGQTVSLTLSGAATLLDPLDPGSLSVVADVDNLKAGTHQVRLKVSLPRFLSLNQTEQSLTVTVELKSKTAPPATEAPEAGVTGSVPTPEPSAEPVSGEEDVTEEIPTSSPEPSATATPVPTLLPEATPENTDAISGSEGTGNAGNVGGTANTGNNGTNGNAGTGGGT